MKTNYFKRNLLLPGLAMMMVQMALVSTHAADAKDNPSQFSASDCEFAKAAASGGMMEVNLGKIALEKSTNAAVLQFGQRMVTEQGKAGQDLQRLAARKGATLPSEPTAEQQKEIDRLSKFSGAEFDKAYVILMVQAHKADEKEFKSACEKAQDPDLKAFAASTLALTQDHLMKAEETLIKTLNDIYQ
jgi:putative membrane protein